MLSKLSFIPWNSVPKWVRSRWLKFWWWNLFYSIRAYVLISWWNVGRLLLYVERPSHWYAQNPFLKTFVLEHGYCSWWTRRRWWNLVSRRAFDLSHCFIRVLHVFVWICTCTGPHQRVHGVLIGLGELLTVDRAMWINETQSFMFQRLNSNFI